MKIISTSDGVCKGLSTTFRRLIPISPKMVTNLDVKQRYLEMLSQVLDSGTIRLITKLVKKGKIVPVECTNDFINQLNKNLKGDACMNPKEYENVLGFYTGKQNRLYILMDNVQRLMTGGSLAIAQVTVHELQHMCCYNFTNMFINYWKKELYSFYSYFCAFLYKAYSSGFSSTWNSVTGKDKQIMQRILDPDYGIKYLVQYLIYNHEYLYCFAGSIMSMSDCKAIGEKFGLLFEQCGCDPTFASEISKKIFSMVKDIFSGKIGSTWRNPDNSTIIDCFRKAYFQVFKKDPWKDGSSLIYQEIVFPSEIISVTSMYFYRNKKYYKFLGSL